MEEISSSNDEYSSTNEDSEYLTSFYRIVMPSVLRECRLVLPKEFVEEYGKELSKTIRLESSVGDIWHIKLQKSGSLLCLQDGLENFMKRHSIDFGYFLIFKYKGNSEFYLHIFDLEATEIDYSKTSRQQLPTDHADVFVANRQPQEGGVSSKRKAFTESPPRKMQKQQSVSRKQFGSTTSDTSKGIKFSNEEVLNCSKSHLVKKEPTWNQEGERKRDNPFCSIQMKKSNVNRYSMFLPTQFTKENIRDYADFIELQDSDDPTRRWPVQCRRYDFRWSLGSGWSKFAKEKRLQDGDECVFEIMAKGIIKVSVIHAKADGSQSPWNQEGERKRDNPFCSMLMTESNVNRYTMYMPLHFTKENMRDYAEFIELQDSDDPTRRWPVHCRRYDLRWSLGKGWSQFVKAKRLHEGDECVFEIMAKGIIKVSVFHAKADGSQSPCSMNLDEEEV